MLRTTIRSVLVALIASASVAISAAAQGGGKIPKISKRYFASGTVHLTMTGSLQVDEDIAINTKASYGDGEMTWMQFGASGAATPNALVTVQPEEIGISVGKGKFIATAEAANCKGKIDVTPTSVSGQYTCPGVTSFDAGTLKMGKVDITVRFTATS